MFEQLCWCTVHWPRVYLRRPPSPSISLSLSLSIYLRILAVYSRLPNHLCWCFSFVLLIFLARSLTRFVVLFWLSLPLSFSLSSHCCFCLSRPLSVSPCLSAHIHHAYPRSPRARSTCLTAHPPLKPRKPGLLILEFCSLILRILVEPVSGSSAAAATLRLSLTPAVKKGS